MTRTTWLRAAERGELARDEPDVPQLGTKLLDHSFFVPMLLMAVVSIATGAAIAVIFY